jgi:hypothetical protein
MSSSLRHELQLKAELDALRRTVIYKEELVGPLDTYISDDRALFRGPNNGTWRVVFNREGEPTFQDLAAIVASRVAQLAGVNPVGETRVVLGHYKGERFVSGVACDVTNLSQLEDAVEAQPIEREVAFWMWVGMDMFADPGALYVTQDGHLVRGDYETAFQHQNWDNCSNCTLRTTFGAIKKIKYDRGDVTNRLGVLRQSDLLNRTVQHVRHDLTKANVLFPDEFYTRILSF